MTFELSEMWNWSRIVHTGAERAPQRVVSLLKEVAGNFNSETAFLLAPAEQEPGLWRIPEGWVYSEKDFSADFSLPAGADVVRHALSDESVVLDAEAGDTIPELLAKAGIRSVVAAAVGFRQREALLVVCNAKKLSGRAPFQVRYTTAHRELAMIMARVISMDGVGKFIHKTRPEVNPRSPYPWREEKHDLLRSNPGWYVAYQAGKRVALEPTQESLVAALERKLGKPRKPCEFHRIVECAAPRRGPSPRTKGSRLQT